MTNKKSREQDALEKLGITGDEAARAEFASHPSHSEIQKKFNEVFAPPEDATRTLVAALPQVPDEISINFDVSVSDGELAMDDKDLELDDIGDLSLTADDTPATLPDDGGLELSLDPGAEGLGVEASAPPADAPIDLDDLDLSLDADETPSAGDSTSTSLKLGDDVDLGEDVLAKLAEIEQIMVEDATKTMMMRPTTSELESGTDAGIELQDMDLSEPAAMTPEETDDLPLNLGLDTEDGADSLTLGAEALLDESADADLSLDEGLDLSLSDDDDVALDGLELSAEDSELSHPGLVEGANFEASPEESLFTRNDITMAGLTRSHVKKELPETPSFSSDEDDLSGAGDALSFDVGDSDSLTQELEEAPEAVIAESVAPTPAPAKVAPAAPMQARREVTSSSEERSHYQEVSQNFNAELERLQATLNHLRGDRGELLKKIETLEEDKLVHQRVVLSMRAELDEKKIEIQLMKKRSAEENHDLKYQLELEQERRKMAEERAKEYQSEIQALQQKVKLEVKKVSSRERDLEQKLELLKSDAETQIKHRDLKILELKRRIDALEFEMDTLNALEQKSVGDKTELEGKLDKAIKTLRTAIGILETDDPKLATLEKLKKNLDV